MTRKSRTFRQTLKRSMYFTVVLPMSYAVTLGMMMQVLPGHFS
jgi:hypothetical protein